MNLSTVFAIVVLGCVSAAIGYIYIVSKFMEALNV